MVIYLELALFPEANLFDCSNEIAKRAHSVPRLKKFVISSLMSGFRVFQLLV